MDVQERSAPRRRSSGSVGRRRAMGTGSSDPTRPRRSSGSAAGSAEELPFARSAAERLWSLIAAEDYVAALGCLTGGQAVECVKAGLKAIYLSGWQVAGDANLAGQTYPDQSALPRQLGARPRGQDQQRAPSRGPDRLGGG